jgi:hypothetical protein
MEIVIEYYKTTKTEGSKNKQTFRFIDAGRLLACKAVGDNNNSYLFGTVPFEIALAGDVTEIRLIFPPYRRVVAFPGA